MNERFWSKVDLRGPMRSPYLGPCWVWTAAVNGHLGYGSYWDGVKQVRSHRFSYELFFGPIAPGLQIDHVCRVPSCVNPAHLEAVTSLENQRRATGVIGERARRELYKLPEPLKRCAKCGVEKSLAEFYAAKRGRFRRSHSCKSCARTRDKQRKRALGSPDEGGER